MYISRSFQAAGIMLVFLLAALDVEAQQAAETININEVANEDIYLAGRTIHVFKEINGDMVSAAQRITVEGSISEDLIAAGERITVRASIGDDARLAGRSIHIEADVGDDLIATGETITVNAETTIGGRVWVAARSVELLGSVGKDIKIAAQDASINGVVNGNVEFIGERIEILPNARIAGNLSYKSPNDPIISAGAKIEGKVVKKKMPARVESDFPVAAVVGIVFLSLLFSISVLQWAFPEMSANAVSQIRNEPLKCLGFGLLTCLLMPVLAAILMVTVIGIPLGLIVIGIYPIVVFSGVAISTLYLSRKLLGVIGLEQKTSAIWIVIGIAIALVVFALTQFIPLLGATIFVLFVIGGVGGVGMEQRQRYQDAK